MQEKKTPGSEANSQQTTVAPVRKLKLLPTEESSLISSKSDHRIIIEGERRVRFSSMPLFGA